MKHAPCWGANIQRLCTSAALGCILQTTRHQEAVVARISASGADAAGYHGIERRIVEHRVPVRHRGASESEEGRREREEGPTAMGLLGRLPRAQNPTEHMTTLVVMWHDPTLHTFEEAPRLSPVGAAAFSSPDVP